MSSARKRAGLSTQQLADAVGIAIQSVRNIERWRSRSGGEAHCPSVELAYRLAAALGVPLDDLTTGRATITTGGSR